MPAKMLITVKKKKNLWVIFILIKIRNCGEPLVTWVNAV